jgi:hypothetical protein
MQKIFVGAVMAALAGVAFAPLVQADTAEASCVIRNKHGDRKGEQSGPCTFGQRQGYIDVTLKDGDTISLSPVGNGPSKYRDQGGQKVSRTSATSAGMEFRWDAGKQLSVTWRSSGDSGDYFVNELDRGGFEIVWKRQSCFISYNAAGHSMSVSPGCDDKQIRRSDEIARDRTR